MTRIISAAAIALVLAGCASQPKGGFCLTGSVQPITEAMIADKSAGGRKALESAVANNELGERLCGWRP